MRPISHTQIPIFLERFDNFINAEIESAEILSATEIKITMKLQDRARAFDWISLSFIFSDVVDAQIPQESHLSFVDMSEGGSLLWSEQMFAFASSECYNATSVKNSSLYIISKSLKYEENQF